MAQKKYSDKSLPDNVSFKFRYNKDKLEKAKGVAKSQNKSLASIIKQFLDTFIGI